MPRLPRYPLVLRALLPLLLAVAYGLAAAPAPTHATSLSSEPEASSRSVTLDISAALRTVDAPGHRFGFSQASLLAQITPSQAQQVLQGLGYTGVATNACASLVGQTCQVTGGVTGSATITGSASWNLSVAAAPAGALVGGIPQAFALTTVNAVGVGEGPFPCTALAVAAGTTTCTFNTVGNPLIGTTVAVCFPPAAAGALPLCVVGSVTGPGAVLPIVPPIAPPIVPPAALIPAFQGAAPPLLPPPPLQFIPPPPPPLLPPPPPAPMGAMAAPRGAFPDVPVIPEADSLLLLVGGLLGLGGLAGYRTWRGRKP
jgi:hypothetical protein